MPIVRLIACACLAVFLQGCSLLKASPAPTTPFLPFPDRLSEMRERSPFNAAYVPDRDKRAPFTVKDFQTYAHVREAIDEWAAQFAELAATSEDHKVEDSAALTLDPT